MKFVTKIQEHGRCDPFNKILSLLFLLLDILVVFFKKIIRKYMWLKNISQIFKNCVT